MTLNNKPKYIVIAVFFAIIGAACNNDKPIPGERPILSYTQPIQNPPDDFLILFNITSAGERSVELTLNESSVWIVEKLGNPRYELLLSNGAANRNITSVDTLGLEANKKYRVVVFSAYYTEFINFFVGFKKTDMTYETFPDKF